MNKIIIFILCLSLCGCAVMTPKNTDNICSIFSQYPKWYWTAQKVQYHWGVPISVLMAVMHQESHFSQNAKPPRQHLLGVIPWFRPTSAYGYSQATDESWRTYQHSTGNSSADRDDFIDAADFVGWYAYKSHLRLGISQRNPYKVYLAYHEGMGGYARKTYLRKRWLIAVAHKVSRRAWIYHRQLMRCVNDLPKKPWWSLW